MNIKIESLFNHPDSFELYGAFFQFVQYVKVNSPGLFNSEGYFIKTGEKEFSTEVLHQVKTIPFFKNFPDKINLLSGSGNLNMLYEILSLFPGLFTSAGKLFYIVKNDLMNCGDSAAIPINNITFTPDSLSYLDEGGFNYIYLIRDNKSVVIRSIKKSLINLRSYKIQQEIHKRISDFIYGVPDLSAIWKVPEVYFVPENEHYMAMEFVPAAEKLTLAFSIMSREDRSTAYEAGRLLLDRLKNVNGERFAHRDLHGGNVLVQFNEKKELAKLWFIDFDFSLFMPSSTGDVEMYRDTTVKGLYKFENDSQIMNVFSGEGSGKQQK